MDLGYNLVDKVVGWSVAIVLAIIVGHYLSKTGEVAQPDSEVVSRIKRGYSIFLLGGQLVAFSSVL